MAINDPEVYCGECRWMEEELGRYDKRLHDALEELAKLKARVVLEPPAPAAGDPSKAQETPIQIGDAFFIQEGDMIRRVDKK